MYSPVALVRGVFAVDVIMGQFIQIVISKVFSNNSSVNLPINLSTKNDFMRKENANPSPQQTLLSTFATRGSMLHSIEEGATR